MWQIVCKNIIVTLVHLFILLCELFINARTRVTLRYLITYGYGGRVWKTKCLTDHPIKNHSNFDILLTVHLSIILVINQLNAQIIVL